MFASFLRLFVIMIGKHVSRNIRVSPRQTNLFATFLWKRVFLLACQFPLLLLQMMSLHWTWLVVISVLSILPPLQAGFCSPDAREAETKLKFEYLIDKFYFNFLEYFGAMHPYLFSSFSSLSSIKRDLALFHQ